MAAAIAAADLRAHGGKARNQSPKPGGCAHDGAWAIVPGRCSNESARIGVQSGVTLVELLVALAVLAILVTLAVPSLQAFVNSNRLRAATNETLATLQTARIEAIRANRRMVACLSADPNADVPACNGAEASGWIVFQDADRNGKYAGSERLVRRASFAGEVRLLGSVALNDRLTFNADGMARDAAGNLLNATVSACLPLTSPRQNRSDISISAGSRFRAERKDAGGKCETPGDKP